MRKQEALHSSLQVGDVHDLRKVALHNGQLLGVALALVLRVLPLQCSAVQCRAVIQSHEKPLVFKGTVTPDHHSRPQRMKSSTVYGF